MNNTSPKVTKYSQTVKGRHIRYATKVTFSDGEEVRFMDLLTKKQAITQAEVYRTRESKINSQFEMMKSRLGLPSNANR
jgi:hypothetical protein